VTSEPPPHDDEDEDEDDIDEDDVFQDLKTAAKLRTPQNTYVPQVTLAY